jgi:hypothetical protein
VATTIKDKRSAAERELKMRMKERSKAEATAARKRRALFVAMDRAQSDGALSYRRIAEVCGITSVRVGQILAEVRKGGES